jgi:hypothetical protein
MSTYNHLYNLRKNRAVAQGFSQLMRVRVWYGDRRGVGSELEKGHDKGKYGDGVIIRMVSLSKDVARKN